MKVVGTHAERKLSLCRMIAVAGTACLLLAGSAPLHAAAASAVPAVDPTVSAGYSAVLYDNRNGLPTSEANAIVETEEGFIWIGSYSGLIRHDGTQFVRMEAAPGLVGIMSLYVDSRHRLWVGMNDGGAAVWDSGGLRLYNKADGLRSLSVRAIAEAGDGSIYLGTTDGVARVGRDMELHVLDESAIRESFIDSLCPGKGNVVYGLTKAGELFTLSDGKLTAFYRPQELGIQGIRAILPDVDRPGCMYLGTAGAEILYGTLDSGFRVLKTYETAPVSYINSFRRIGDAVWVCADTGIGCLKDGRFIPLTQLPLSISVEDVMLDYQGNLWFVSSQQGVMKIVPNRFIDLFDQYRLPDDVVTATCVQGDRLFVGTKNNGMLVLQDGAVLDSLPVTSFRFAGRPADRIPPADNLLALLAGSRIRSIVCDSRKRLWISTFGDYALLRYDNGAVTCFSEACGMPSNRIRTVFEQDDGSGEAAVVAVCTGGLAVIKGDAVVRVYDEAAGISNREILTASPMPGGAIVAGTDGGGIYVVQGNSVKHIGTEEGLSSEVVMRIKPGLNRDIIWMVCGNALAYMTADFQVHTLYGFPYPNNFDLYETEGGDLWVLSSNGIYVCKVEQLLRDEKIIPLYYGLDNGLPCIATSNSYSGMSEDCDLYIAGTTGVTRVNIRRNEEPFADFKLAVPFVACDGSLLYPDADGVFRLPPTVRRLTVHGYACNYSLADPQLSYRLEGVDTAACSVKRSRFAPVSYTNLKGGDYRFVLQLLDAQGAVCKELSVPIVKQKALHELLRVRIAVLLLLLGIFAAVVRLYIRDRTRRFQRQAAAQRQLTREIVEAFAKVIDMKDRYTNGHSSRVAEYTQMLARELGCDDDTVERYYNIALLHDIGKIGIPSEILNKPGKLTAEEFNTIKSHSALGYEALKDISLMPELAVGAGAHHERPDGMGYPRGLTAGDIPRVAQIISVADTFDAMYSDRPYRKRMNFETAVSIMKDVSGSQLAPDVVDAFLRLIARGKFRDPDDDGGGTTEDINNIRRRFAGSGVHGSDGHGSSGDGRGSSSDRLGGLGDSGGSGAAEQAAFTKGNPV